MMRSMAVDPCVGSREGVLGANHGWIQRRKLHEFERERLGAEPGTFEGRILTVQQEIFDI
jgi:hypothetical protein